MRLLEPSSTFGCPPFWIYFWSIVIQIQRVIFWFPAKPMYYKVWSFYVNLVRLFWRFMKLIAMISPPIAVFASTPLHINLRNSNWNISVNSFYFTFWHYIRTLLTYHLPTLYFETNNSSLAPPELHVKCCRYIKLVFIILIISSNHIWIQIYRIWVVWGYSSLPQILSIRHYGSTLTQI